MAAEVKIYTREWCGYCTAALRLLKAKGVSFEHIDVTGNPDMRRWLVEATGRTTVPQIFIDGEAVGGYTDIRALDERGVLDRMLAGNEKNASL
ncbi:MAG: glutaredoxin [Kofleriaceae bacterium]|nr:glutaredoxin [Kofleriaceae bacterium]